MSDDPVFLFNGERHPMPDLSTFTFDESVVMYEYCNLTVEDFAPTVEGDTDPEAEQAERARKARHPGFLKTLIHVAYQRAHPKLSKDKVAAIVGSANLLEVLEALADMESEGDADDPPAAESMSVHSEPSTKSSPERPLSSEERPASSGSGSESGTDAPAEGLPATGRSSSDTSRTFDRVMSAT